eukprot:3985794-Pyramimonas_sp.AAC.1
MLPPALLVCRLTKRARWRCWRLESQMGNTTLARACSVDRRELRCVHASLIQGSRIPPHRLRVSAIIREPQHTTTGLAPLSTSDLTRKAQHLGPP